MLNCAPRDSNIFTFFYNQIQSEQSGSSCSSSMPSDESEGDDTDVADDGESEEDDVSTTVGRSPADSLHVLGGGSVSSR